MHAPSDAKARKALPLCTGVLDYFPDALLAVAEVSRIGNEQHNPGEPLHWAKEKSTDEADALARHLIDRGTRDADGVRHSAKVAWRALALLQREIEAERAIIAVAPTPPFYPCGCSTLVCPHSVVPLAISPEHDAIAEALDAKAGGTEPPRAWCSYHADYCAGPSCAALARVRRQGDLY